MPGRKTRTSRALILITVILCLVFGATLTQSSANPSPITDGTMPDMLVVTDGEQAAEAEASISDGTAATDELSDGSQAEPTVTPTPEPTPVPTQEPVVIDASPEAVKGVWTADGSSWRFMVDGNSFTGWFTDTDGKRYYFNKDGIMQTGWLNDGDKRYYLNADGIMQTGDISVDGEVFHLLADGSLEGYVPEEPKPRDSEKKEEKKTEDKKKEAEKTEKKEAKADKKSKDKPRKTVALTFDDGPSSFTGRLLDCLEANNAKATFFMVGQEIDNFPDTVKRMAALGCELGNHTYSHADLTTLDAEGMSEEIGGTDRRLVELTGQGASVLRPPYGSIDDNVTATVGTPMILWSIDTLDWETMDVQTTVDNVLSQVEDGSIILMHDIFETSVDAAEILIPELIKQGYELVTVHELAAAHGVELKTGIAYGAMNK